MRSNLRFPVRRELAKTATIISDNKKRPDKLPTSGLQTFRRTKGATNRLGRAHIVSALLLCTVLSACSPALNWRSVTLQGVQAALPCKPDQAERPVQLAGLDLSLAMVGCEADGGLYAISHIRLAQGAQAQAVIDAWRDQAMQAMRATQAPLATSIPALGPRSAITVYQASGVNPRGQAVQARWTWVQRDQEIYHWALYAPAIRTEMEEPFFGAFQWQ